MSPYQQDVIDTTLKSFEDQAARRLRNMLLKLLALVHLVVVEKVYKELSLNQHQIETEQH